MNWKRALLAASFAFPVIALLAWGFSRDPGEIVSPLPGREAPPFMLQVFATGEGTLAEPIADTVRLDDLRGNVVVLNFWASWCLACRDEHQALSAAAQRYADQPVRFYGVLYQDRQASALAWITRMGGQTYPSLDDPGSRAAIGYGLYGVPETFIVDQAGRIAVKKVGPVTHDFLVGIIDSLLAAGRAPVEGR